MAKTAADQFAEVLAIAGAKRICAEEHAPHGQDFVAAPVLGNPDFARARKLFVLAAGQH